MATRSANINIRIDPNIKMQGAAILKTLGLSESTFVDMAYRQLILQRGIPFSVTIPKDIPTRDTMTDEAFNSMMATGVRQAMDGDYLPADEAFESILQRL